MSAEVKEVVRRTKRVRRDYQNELKELRMYCAACIKSFERIEANLKTASPELIQGYLGAYKDIRDRLDGVK